YVGGELVLAYRSYTPDANSTLGGVGISDKIYEKNSPTFIPIIAASTRFGYGRAPATRFAFAIAAYDAYGGAIAYKESDLSLNGGKAIGLISTSLTDFELVPTVAYQINEVLSLGAGLRIGINNFTVKTNQDAFAADLSGNGVGIG